MAIKWRFLRQVGSHVAGNLSGVWMERREKEGVSGLWWEENSRSTGMETRGNVCVGKPQLPQHCRHTRRRKQSRRVTLRSFRTCDCLERDSLQFGRTQIHTCLNSLSRKIVEPQVQKEKVRCQQLRGSQQLSRPHAAGQWQAQSWFKSTFPSIVFRASCLISDKRGRLSVYLRKQAVKNNTKYNCVKARRNSAWHRWTRSLCLSLRLSRLATGEGRTSRGSAVTKQIESKIFY